MHIFQSLESEKKASVSHLEELHSVARKECEEARAELVREITAKLQVSNRGRAYGCTQYMVGVIG